MPNALNLAGIALSIEQGKWRRRAAELAKGPLASTAEAIDRTGDFPRASLDAIAAAGMLGLTVSKEKGGAGEGILTTAIVIEELARGCSSAAMCYCMHMSTVPVVDALAAGAQVDDLLGPITSGKWLGSLAMSEPGSGNRLWHMDSYAQPDGDDFIIDSFKSFATSSGEASYYLVPVRASSTSGPQDLSLFMIDGRDPNILPIGTWDGMGLRGNSSRPIHFRGCRVPAARRLGDPTCGFSMLFAYSLPIYQVGLSAVYLGVAEAAFQNALAHVKKRIHSDTNLSLARVETVQRYIAEMRASIDAARCMIYRVAQMSDNAMVLFDELNSAGLLDEVIRANPDDPFFIELAQVKFFASEMVIGVTARAFQVCGGSAYKRGHPVERAVRDARAASVMAPSDDTLKLIVGRQLLGIPQPWE